MQKLAELTCDGFGFCLGSREAEQDVIRVAGVTEPSRVRVVWIALRQPLERLAEFPCLGGLSCLSAPMHPFVDDAIGGIGLPRFPAVVVWQERLFDELVEWLLLDSRVVDVTMSYNPIFASCVILSVIIFQGHINELSVADTHLRIRPWNPTRAGRVCPGRYS